MKSISYTFRLNPSNPMEKRAHEILERNLKVLQSDPNALRRIITNALLAMEKEKAEPTPRQMVDLKATSQLVEEARRLVSDLKRIASTGGATYVKEAMQENGLDDDFLDGATSLVNTKEF